MVSADNVRNWVDADLYMDLLGDVAGALRLPINAGVIPDVIFQHDANKFNAANLEPADLNVLASDIELVRKYVGAKLKLLGESAEEQEGRGPEDEDDVVLEVHPFYKNFLNIYLIELHFLRFNPDGLERYLKAVRIPGAKKYAVQISKMHAAITR